MCKNLLWVQFHLALAAAANWCWMYIQPIMDLLLEQRAESREQRAESREQRAESREQRAESREQRAESREQRAERAERERAERAERAERERESREQRAESREQSRERSESRAERENSRAHCGHTRLLCGSLLIPSFLLSHIHMHTQLLEPTVTLLPRLIANPHTISLCSLSALWWGCSNFTK